MGESVGDDEIHIAGVLQHNLVEDIQGEQGEIHSFSGHRLELRQYICRERLGYAAGQAEDRMDGFAGGQRGQLPQLAPHGDDLLAGLDTHLGDDAENVALGLRRGGADHEIGPAQKVEVQRVVFGHERRIDQLPDLFGRRWRGDFVKVVQRLGGSHVMRGGADAADPRRDLRHVFG